MHLMRQDSIRTAHNSSFVPRFSIHVVWQSALLMLVFAAAPGAVVISFAAQQASAARPDHAAQKPGTAPQDGTAPSDRGATDGSPQGDSGDEMWFGVMRAKEIRQFRFVVELTHQNDQWSGVLTSLDEGESQFELADVIRTDSRLKFELPKTKAIYDGKIDEKDRSMQGTWSQDGHELALQFRQVKERPARNVESAWKGTLDMGLQRLEVAFVHLQSGELLLDSMTQKAGGFIAKDESTDDEVVYRVPAVGGTFRGKYSADGSQIEGEWSQNFISLKLDLTKVKQEELAAKRISRPQTPKSPFPYDSRQVQFTSTEPDVTLSGTLTVPHGDVSAGVVMISGSGPQDRDETLLDHKPFLVIADFFARQGIATLRFDDRGTGQSSGEFGTANTMDFANDAEGAIQYLQSVSALENVPLGFCGHSEGGLIAPIVAARNDHVDFIILMAGTGVNGEKILYNQARLILEAEGVPEEDIQRNTAFQRVLLSNVIKHPEASREELEKKITAELKLVLSEDELDRDDYAKKVKAGIAQVDGPWFRQFLILEPKDALKQVRCPVLAINGEKDTQVDPKLNLPAIRAALVEGGNNKFEIIEFPGLNHLFQACETGSVREYQDIDETFNEQALKKMAEWILALTPN